MGLAFLDSNILIYTASSDARKAAAARELLFAGGVISIQVLNETANVAVRKMRLSWAEVDDLLMLARNLVRTEPVTIETHERGLSIARRYKLAVYDGMIAAAALIADCDTLYSEDMQHGQLIDGRLRIVNPFLG